MAHYKSYDSFKTKRSVEKKNRAKKKSEKQNNDIKDFVIDNTDDYGTVIAVRYDDAYVLYNNEVVLTKIRPDLNLICNKVLFPGDKVVLQYKSDAICIYHRLARKTLLSRVKKDSTRLDESVGLTKNIAANIECAVIVVAAKEPPLHGKKFVPSNDINKINQLKRLVIDDLLPSYQRMLETEMVMLYLRHLDSESCLQQRQHWGQRLHRKNKELWKKR